jgi:hypothetical protein
MQVITDTNHCLPRDEVYNEGVATVADGSKIQQLIADYREAGLSFSQTTLMINMYCNKNNLHTVTRSGYCVLGLVVVLGRLVGLGTAWQGLGWSKWLVGLRTAWKGSGRKGSGQPEGVS